MKNDGGPAFPRPYGTDEHEMPCNVNSDQTGMSLRDWFAGQALAGFCAADQMCSNPADTAVDAYKLADAMLKARGK